MSDTVIYDKIQGVGIIKLRFNEINLEQREDIKEKFKSFLDAGDTRFIIDLSKVGFLSSLVLALIVFFSQEVKDKAGVIKLSGLTSEALGVFQVTQLDKGFEMYDTEEQALESFNE